MSPHPRRQGRIDGCARRPQSRFAGTSSTRQGGGFARPSEKSRSTTGQEKSLIEAGTVVASEVVAGTWEASPAMRYEKGRSRDAIAAEQEAAGPCRKTRRGRRKRRHGNCIFWGFAQQCGSGSSSSKDGGSPCKTNPHAGPGRLTRRRARQVPLRSRQKTSRGASGAAPARGVSRGLSLTELIETRSLTGLRAPSIALRPGEDVARPFAGDGEAGKPEGGWGARPELRPEAPAGGARRAPTRWRRSRTPCTVSASRDSGRRGSGASTPWRWRASGSARGDPSGR